MLSTLEEIPIEAASGRSVTIGGKRIRQRGVGNSRLTVRWRGFIVKVGDQGTFEAERWNKVRPEHAKYFVPIVGSGMIEWKGYEDTGAYGPRTCWVAQTLIQVRKFYPWPLAGGLEASYEELKAVVRQYGVVDFDLFETPNGLAAHNWTLYKGAPVIYDYGF